MKYNQTLTTCIFFLVLSWTNSTFAQQYAQITRDFECKVRENGRKIQLFKGEIYEIYQDETTAKLTSNKKGIILKINNISIEIPWGSGTKQTYKYPINFDLGAFKTIQDKSYNFLTRSEKTGKYRFDISELQTNDTIFFASYNAKGVVKLLNTKSIEVDSSYFEKNYYGQVIRMMIPNYPTIGFEWDKIDFPLNENPAETPAENTELDGEESEAEAPISPASNSFLTNTRNLILIIAVLALIGIVFIVFRGRLFSDKEKKNTVKNAPKRHNELKRRRRLAEESMPMPAVDTSDEGPTSDNVVTENNINSEIEENVEIPTSETPSVETEMPAQISPEPTPKEEDNRIIIEREKPTYIPENQIIIKESSTEDLEKIKTLEEKLSILETEKADLQKRLVETENQTTTTFQTNTSENTNSGIQGITIGNYAYLCEWFKNYLEKAEYVETKVKEFHDRSVKEDAQTEKAIIEGILYRFYTAKNGISSYDYWNFIIQELENTHGKIIESRLRKELETIAEEERVAYLQNRLFKDVLTGYFGAILMMCEEMRNIDRFTNLKFLLAENISAHFAKESETLVQAFSGSISRRVNYVPLFETYSTEDEDLKIQLISSESFVKPAYYDEVKVEKGEILVIRKYGFGDTPSEILVG